MYVEEKEEKSKVGGDVVLLACWAKIRADVRRWGVCALASLGRKVE